MTYESDPHISDTSDSKNNILYHRQVDSAMYECPDCNLRDANPSEITKHLESWHKKGGEIS